MLQIQYVLSSPDMEATQPGAPDCRCNLRPRPRRLRHYIVGSPEDTRHAIDRLHLLTYIDRVNWILVSDHSLQRHPDPP
jgi:hypothetical protein